MKKLSYKQKQYLIRKSALGNKPKNATKVTWSELKNYILPKAQIRFHRGRPTLTAPKVFNLSQNAQEVLDFLRLMRQLARVDTRLFIDFTKIETLSPMCALLLTSEIDRWRQFGRKRLRVIDRDKWSPTIKFLLSQMGFNELINPSDTFYLQTDLSPIRYLRLKSGTYGDAEVAEHLAENICRMAGDIQNGHLLHEGLTEAMINSKKWAYKDSVPDSQRRWWLTGSFNTETQDVIIMIYDHGVGIPQTVPVNGLQEIYKDFLESLGIKEIDDAYWLKAAMTVGRTASGLPNRGKGLRDIQEFILASKRGTLRVLSGKGEYTINQSGYEETKLHHTPLNGTLIAWQVNIKEDV